MNTTSSLCDIMRPNSVWADIEVPNKKYLLQDIAFKAAGLLGLEDHVIFDVLWEREKLGTTGVGRGIAIPHGRVAGLKDVTGFFFRLTPPLSYDSIDDQPVDLVFLLLAPDTAGADHLHALAAISRTLRDEAFCAELRAAKTDEELTNLLKKSCEEAAA